MTAEDIVRALGIRDEPVIVSDRYGDIEGCQLCDAEPSPTGAREWVTAHPAKVAR